MSLSLHGENAGNTAVLEEDWVAMAGRSQWILDDNWDVTICSPGVTPVMDISPELQLSTGPIFELSR